MNRGNRSNSKRNQSTRRFEVRIVPAFDLMRSHLSVEFGRDELLRGRQTMNVIKQFAIATLCGALLFGSIGCGGTSGDHTPDDPEDRWDQLKWDDGVWG